MEHIDRQTLISALGRDLQWMAWPLAVSRNTVTIPAAVAAVSEISSRSAGVRVLLGLAERRSALVIDDSFGTVALSLAREYSQVHALYTNSTSLEIARARAEHLRVSNIQFQLSRDVEDLSAVPFDLDCAVVNCVDRKLIAESFCRHVFEHLTSQASVLFTVEDRSRFAVGCMLSLYRRLRRHFRTIDLFAYDRGLSNSFELRPLLKPSFRKSHIFKRLARACSSRAFAYVASKQSEQESCLDEIRSVLKRSHGLALQWERLFFANPAGMTAMGRGIDTGELSIVRVPLSDQAKRQHQQNADNLQAFAGAGLDTFNVPRLLASGEVHGYAFSVESAISGKSIDAFNVHDSRAFGPLFASAVDSVESLHTRTASPRVLSGGIFDELVERPLTVACKMLGYQDGAEHLGEISNIIRKELKQAMLPLVFMHGDYTFDNMRFEADGQRVSGIFDWDLGMPAGLPLLDLLYFIVSAAMKRTGVGLNRAFRQKCVLLDFDAVEQAALTRYCCALDLKPSFIRPLALLTWMYHVGVRNINPEPYEYCPSYWAETLSAVREIAAPVDPAVPAARI